MTSPTRIVTARPPRRIRHKPSAQPLAIQPIVRPDRGPEPDEAKLGDAADRLWKELVRRVEAEGN